MPRREDVWNASHKIIKTGLEIARYRKAAQVLDQSKLGRAIKDHRSKIMAPVKRLYAYGPPTEANRAKGPTNGRTGGRRGKAGSQQGTDRIVDQHKNYNFIIKNPKIPGSRYTFTGILEVSNNVASTGYGTYYIGFGVSGDAGLFRTLSSDALALLSIFTRVHVHNVKIRYVGTSASTQTGYMAVGLDGNTDSNVSNATNVAALMASTTGSDNVSICDAKGEMTVSYSPPPDLADCISGDGSADLHDKWCGKFRFVTSNGSGIGVSTGLFHIQTDVTLRL